MLDMLPEGKDACTGDTATQGGACYRWYVAGLLTPRSFTEGRAHGISVVAPAPEPFAGRSTCPVLLIGGCFQRDASSDVPCPLFDAAVL